MYKIIVSLTIIVLCILAALMIVPALIYAVLFIWRYINARLYQHYTHCTRKEAYKKFKIY